MIRYFCLIGLWICCFALLSPSQSAPSQATHLSGSSDKSAFAPCEDWQLPTFVAQAPSSNGPSHSQKPAKKHRETALAEKKASAPATHPSSAKSAHARETTIAEKKPTEPAVRPSSTSLTLGDSARSADVSGPDVSKPAPASDKPGLVRSLGHVITATAQEAQKKIVADTDGLVGRLARLTAYWAGEGDYYTGRHLSATGIHLHGGHCAVDPSIIPYGSVVVIPGIGQFLAVDTGSAVVSRTAAREAGHTRAERGALVIDLFFENRAEGERFAAQAPKFVDISWWTPSSNSHAAQEARSVFADEEWNKIYSKQL